MALIFIERLDWEVVEFRLCLSVYVYEFEDLFVFD